MLDGSLVQFCSKCLVACMRANGVLKMFEKDQVCELTAQVRTVRLCGADGPHPYQRACLALVEIRCDWGDSPAQVGGRSAALTQNVPDMVFSLVEAMICAADGPPMG